MMMEKQQLFTIKYWQESIEDQKTEWRGRVQHLASGEKRYFKEAAKMEEFIQNCLHNDRQSLTNSQNQRIQMEEIRVNPDWQLLNGYHSSFAQKVARKRGLLSAIILLFSVVMILILYSVKIIILGPNSIGTPVGVETILLSFINSSVRKGFYYKRLRKKYGGE